MSNLALLTPEENAAAAKQGWTVEHVYDSAQQKWRVQILPLWGATKFPNAEQAGAAVVAQARFGDALSLKALRLFKKYT